uniref:Tyrosine-protein kinase receptor n=1 Tax=Elaeophora elaphi TaxID=1147741 RepID=A0A0R3S680_9BILA
VNNVVDGKSSSINKLKGKSASRITNFQNEEYFEEVYSSLLDMKLNFENHITDRNLRAAMMFINSSPVISAQCKHYSHAVACYHMYKICERGSGTDYRTTSGMPHILTICRKDCDSLQGNLCPKELALAAEHDLVGDDPKALLPKCQSLNPKAEYCIPIISVADQSEDSTGLSSDSSKELPHWCYVGSGKTYDGNASLTKSGKRCMNWTQSSSREFNIDRYPSLRTSKNYCRNPGGKKSSPWCFAHPNGQEEYCDINQCPASMYPYLRDREVMGTIDDDGSIIGDISDIWSGLSSPWQLAVLGGFGFFIFSLILLCCYCCCRRKRRETTGSSSTIKKNGLQNCNGCSIASNAVNNTYYRKLNGTANTDPNNAAFELSSLIQAPTNSNTFMQHHHSGSYAQYSPRPSTEPSVEPYQIPEIQSSQLQIGDLIGEGQFGVIHNGNWHGSLLNGEPMQEISKYILVEESIHRCEIERERYEQVIDQERIIADNEDFLRIALQVIFLIFNYLTFFHRIILLKEWNLMVECWHEHPERRPTFSELYSRLQTWSLTSPSQSVLSHQQNHPGSSHSDSSAAANRGSRQSSSTPSVSLLRGATANTSLGTAPSMSTTAFSVPSPAPMQTMMTLNSMHPYQVGAVTYCRSTHLISGGSHNRSPKTRLQNAAARTSNNATATASLIRHSGTSNFNYSGDDAASEESD